MEVFMQSEIVHKKFNQELHDKDNETWKKL